jgi:uncharacterized protein YhbP (UPF0306 family)
MTADGTAAHERRLLHEYVRKGKLMQLATTSPLGAPWLAHCWYAADERLNLLFMSRARRRHSLEITANPRVAGGIIATDLDGLGQKVRGVIFEGTAEEVGDGELEQAFRTYRDRWPQVEGMASVEMLRAQGEENRLWQVMPTSFVLFDEVNFPTEPRREIGNW